MITNKIAICVFWEKNGILRDYVEYYLKGLQQIAKKILVVVNGKISSDSICKLKK
jgi:lipopolysaccharide biosynthesis protein